MWDYVIVGAGPAGLQLGYEFQRAGFSYRILERGAAPGAFFERFPRHRMLLSINKIYTGYDDPEVNLRWDWNSLLGDPDDPVLLRHFSERYWPSADDLMTYLAEFARRYELAIDYGVAIERISKMDNGFALHDAQGHVYGCKRLVMATGVSKPYHPPIPGIELVEDYSDVSVDPDEFRNQRVLILGKGNSAFETAENLTEKAALIHLASPNSLKLAWATHFVGHLRAVNNNLLDTYQLKLQNALLDATIEGIERRGGEIAVRFRYQHAHGEREELLYDRVIACTGFRFDAELFDASCRPELVIDGRFPAQTSSWRSRNVEGLYFAGTIMQARDFKQSSSGFIHGFRYNVRALSQILAHQHHQIPLPHKEIAATPRALRDAVIENVNRTSALWQQFGFLADVLVVPEDEHEQAYYYEALPIDYVHESDLGREDCYYLITLEYGDYHPEDPFSAVRIERHDVDRASASKFLHPVIRRFSCGRLISEHHIIEDLASEWKEEEHTAPLLAYFDREYRWTLERRRSPRGTRASEHRAARAAE